MRYADSCCTYTETATHYVYTGTCIKCKKKISVNIPSQELFAYRQGGHIQDAMPSVVVSDREFLMSGICGACFDKIFAE